MKQTDWNEIIKPLGIDAATWQQAMEATDRVVQLTTTAGTYWLKKAAPARGIFRYHALNLFSWLLRLPLLKAVPQPGGQAAIANEVKRLQTLMAAGVPVAPLVAHADDWLLIKDVGTSIIRAMKNPRTEQPRRQALFQACLQAIKAVHQQGQYLSQAFIRNLLLQDAESLSVAFIDFEDDPLTVMSVAEAQARDVLLLVNSTARFFVNDTAFFQSAIEQFMQGHDAAMIDALRTTANRMQWISRVPFQGLLGHDYQKLKVGILALKDL
ncbi:hypothetical protein [Marinicella meishanensis]|uniref:hypothetical protein n=1 Tax=Marinicella meishanensis TaxID=2873263 RepID=UPI001CBF90D5|nr:hypothetical protein [Marinicella sp. NBU2979]